MATYPNGQEIWDYLMILIGNEYGVAGLMGNLYAESGLLPFRKQGDSDSANNYPISHEYSADVTDGTITETTFVNDSIGYGLAQWTSSSRKQGLYDITVGSGYGVDNLQRQLAYIQQELEGSYSPTLTVLVNATSVRQASDRVLHYYESPADQSTAVEIYRANLGIDIYNTYSGSTPQPPIPPQPIRRKSERRPLYFYITKRMRYKKGIL